MILLTIGTQLPFDRLVRAMDDIASSLPQPIFGQIGKSAYRPKNFEWSETLAPADFDQKFSKAHIVVSHAGIGTVLTAQRHRKPIILFPRLASHGEHRNDHQLATCAQLKGRDGILIAVSGEELLSILTSELPIPGDYEMLKIKRAEFTSLIADKINQLIS